MPMHWSKPSIDTVALFESVAPRDPSVQSKKSFGMPSRLVNGNMFCGVFGDDLVVRLPEADRAELVTLGGRAFEPAGRTPQRDFLVVPFSMRSDLDVVRAWMDRSLAYARTLPEKVPTVKPPSVGTRIAKAAKKVIDATGAALKNVVRRPQVEPAAPKRTKRAEPAVDPARAADAPITKRRAVVEAQKKKRADELQALVGKKRNAARAAPEKALPKKALPKKAAEKKAAPKKAAPKKAAPKKAAPKKAAAPKRKAAQPAKRGAARPRGTAKKRAPTTKKR